MVRQKHDDRKSLTREKLSPFNFLVLNEIHLIFKIQVLKYEACTHQKQLGPHLRVDEAPYFKTLESI